MRILLVSETYPPEINGVAMTTQRLVTGLRARGHWVGLVRPRQAVEGGGGHDTWTLPGLPIPGYSGLRLGLPAWRSMGRLIAEQQPDLVHVVTEGPLGWAALGAARRRGVPVTSGYHTHFDQYSDHYGASWLTPWVTRWLDGLHRRCQATFVPTTELADELNARGIPNVQALGRGVDTRLFHPQQRDPALRTRWGLAPDEPACLYVGRLAPEKNLALVEQAFAAIVAQHPKARMIWVGDGPALAGLRTRQPQHVFAGPKVGQELAAHYASADLFLFGSLSETWGNVCGEAMASGLAVVAYRRAAAAQLIVSGENGLTVQPGDAPAFIRAGLALVSQPGFRQRLGLQAIRTMQPLGWEVIVERFEGLLRECLFAQAS